jgi:hypothetical protein
MADRYIDYFEVEEYGGHFLREALGLVGLDPVVSAEELIAYVGASITRVREERDKAGLTRSSLRTGRGDTSGAVVVMREVLTRFFSYLGSLDAQRFRFDLEAFFYDGTLGKIAHMKSDDLRAKADQVLLGFEAGANAALPGRDDWEAQLLAARDALAAALSGKGRARGQQGQVTKALKAAREEFLFAYNSVAKIVVRGLLNKLGRGDELKRYFKDLQVSEEARRPAASAQATRAEAAPDGRAD